MGFAGGAAETAHFTCLCFMSADCGQERQCLVSSAGTVHPVQGYLERFDVGLGCAARGSGPQETHVIAMARASHSSNQQVRHILLTASALTLGYFSCIPK